MTRAAILSAAGILLMACDALPWQYYSQPATSMEPTIPQGSRFIAAPVSLADLQRGDIVIVEREKNGRQERLVKRLVGLPGDTVAMRSGVIVLNGAIVAQHKLGTYTVAAENAPNPATLLSEQLPGEAEPHRVLDRGDTPGDEFGPLLLGADQYFLLGDNRDNSADSRFDTAGIGLGVVRGEQIRQRVSLD